MIAQLIAAVLFLNEQPKLGSKKIAPIFILAKGYESIIA
jgi:hypothetical protein